MNIWTYFNAMSKVHRKAAEFSSCVNSYVFDQCPDIDGLDVFEAALLDAVLGADAKLVGEVLKDVDEDNS